MHHTTH